MVAFAQISFGNHAGDAPQRFEAAVRQIPEILSCHNTSGECDYLLQVVAPIWRPTGGLHQVLRQLPGVTAIRSNLSLRRSSVRGAFAPGR